MFPADYGGLTQVFVLFSYSQQYLGAIIIFSTVHFKHLLSLKSAAGKMRDCAVLKY